MALYDFPFPTRRDHPLAITHVTVVPMESADVLADQTVVIANGRIRALGPTETVPIETMQTIDGRGKFVMPGLADMHVHYWELSEVAMFLANGVTTVRNMWGAPFHLALQHRVERGEIPGPFVITTSPIIDGPGPDGKPLWQGSVLLDNPEAAEPLVERYQRRGYQQIKAYSLLQPEPLDSE
jgi:hypothetical protein